MSRTPTGICTVIVHCSAEPTCTHCPGGGGLVVPVVTFTVAAVTAVAGGFAPPGVGVAELESPMYLITIDCVDVGMYLLPRCTDCEGAANVMLSVTPTFWLETCCCDDGTGTDFAPPEQPARIAVASIAERTAARTFTSRISLIDHRTERDGGAASVRVEGRE